MAVDGPPTRLANQESGSHDDENIRTYEEVWRVNVTSATDGVATAGSAPGLPRLYMTPYREDFSALAVDIRPERVDGTRTAWDVTVEYSTDLFDTREPEDNPLAEPAKISWDTTQTAVWRTRDLDGKPYMNTSGELIGPVQREKFLEELVVHRNQPQFNGQLIRPMIGSVNSVAFSGGEDGTVLLKKVSSSQERRGQITYWPHEYRFLYDPEGWEQPLLNEGFTEVIDGERHEIIDVNGLRISKAVPLKVFDSDSLELPLGPDGFDDSEVQFLDFRNFEKVDFNILGLPV